MTKQLALYHYWRSSCSWRVRWALAFKGITYNQIPVNLLQGEHQTNTYNQKNPANQVPTLTIDGEHFSESIAVLEWLEEAYPQVPLLPQDPLARLRVRELVQMVAAGIQPVQNMKIQKYISAECGGSGQDFAQHWISKGFEALENRLSQGLAGTYCFGGQITFADLALVPQCYNALRFNVPLYRYPIIKRIYDRCLTTQACRVSAPENQPGAQP